MNTFDNALAEQNRFLSIYRNVIENRRWFRDEQFIRWVGISMGWPAQKFADPYQPTGERYHCKRILKLKWSPLWFNGITRVTSDLPYLHSFSALFKSQARGIYDYRYP